MISVASAKNLVYNNAAKLAAKKISLYEAGALVLAEDVYASCDVPPFNQSAMDGYAYKYDDWNAGSSLHIIGERAAGDSAILNYLPNSAVRIFTGAEIPQGYDTVVMQEKTQTKNKQLFIEDQGQTKGANIRCQGSQTKKGNLALSKGSVLSPAGVGYLAGVGIAEVYVHPLPRVTIISTGKELNPPGTNLQAGKVYECNTYSLNAALKELKVIIQNIYKTEDNEAEIREVIRKALLDSDLIILSGGISVGDYDFVKPALEAAGVKEIFHKVKQKPGKPLYFGKKEETLVFALPGNPAALLTCFYEYVRPAINLLAGRPKQENNSKRMALSSAYYKKQGLTHFLKGIISGKEVRPLANQESYLMNSFAEANCLIQLDEDGREFAKGDLVEVHLLKNDTTLEYGL